MGIDLLGSFKSPDRETMDSTPVIAGKNIAKIVQNPNFVATGVNVSGCIGCTSPPVNSEMKEKHKITKIPTWTLRAPLTEVYARMVSTPSVPSPMLVMGHDGMRS